MRKNHHWSLLTALFLVGCGGSKTPSGSLSPSPPPPNAIATFQEMSGANLPTAMLNGMCMDAAHGDVDGDGDIDLALAQELSTNIVLLNDGFGVFTFSAGAVNGGTGDNEDVVLIDFGGDNLVDMLTVHEDDAVHSILINDGNGIFTNVPALIPVTSIANAVEVIDLNNDQRPDILLGNRGPNLVLLQLADGSYVNVTLNRPIGADVTQDLLLLDVDGDADQDLFVANEGGNRLFINNGAGIFTDETLVRLPVGVTESREADAADIDNDGDIDIVVANVNFQTNQAIGNRLLLNNGSGVFSDATATSLGNIANLSNSFTIKFVDIDADGDPDILSPINRLGLGGGVDVWLNDGMGTFSTGVIQNLFSADPAGSIFDIEVADFNADGKEDIYFCHRTGTDQLYLQQ